MVPCDFFLLGIIAVYCSTLKLCLYTKSFDYGLFCFVTGSLDAAQSSKKRSSSKVVVFVLLLCVVLTTFAFLASVACYFYRRDNCTVQPPIFSSDKETSCNSGTDLISHRNSSMLETKLYINSPINQGIGNYSNKLQRSVCFKTLYYMLNLPVGLICFCLLSFR